MVALSVKTTENVEKSSLAIVGECVRYGPLDLRLKSQVCARNLYQATVVIACVPYITRGLVSVLLDYACEHDPESISIGLTVTRARELTDTDSLSPDAPVFTHFYLPDAGQSVNAVFGVDLSTPRTQGRFVSHPTGNPDLTLTDDLHEIVFVAVPPWDDLVAFDRSGRQQSMTVLDAEPPTESVF
jgi:hypothetical protein